MPTNSDSPGWHGTTIVAVRKGNTTGRSGPPAKVVTKDVRFF